MPVEFKNTELPDIIELKGISQTYSSAKGPVKVIDNLNLLIEDKPNQGQFVVILGKSGCVDADTEFFNGTEWKKISDWKNDKVLQYNENGTAELVSPSQYIILPEKELNLIQSEYGVDQCICNEHTVVYITKRKDRPKNLQKITGKELVQRQEKNSCGFQGGFITTFQYGGKGIPLSDEHIRIMVAVMADGHFTIDSTLHCIVRLKKERKKIRLTKLLADANTPYEKKEELSTGFSIFKFYPPRKEKEFTDFWYSCSNRQLAIIIQESLLWDGSTVNNRRYVSTTIKKTADFLQFASSATGIRSTISINDRRGETQGDYIRKSIEYKVLLSQNILVGIGGPKVVKIKKYQTKDGKKYCFTVPSGMLILRRNNKIVITGNCGKSTLLRYIAGLQKPTTGEVLIHGKPRTPETKVGMVFQQYSSFPWLTVLENVEMGLMLAGVSKVECKERAMAMIKTCGLEGHEKKFAKGPGLSGGQLQRVAIARSLVATPDILLMDEPYGALDIYTRMKMQEMLGEIWSKPGMNLTVIFVTHDISEAVFLGDDVWIMSANPGQIVECVHVDIPLTRAKYMKREKKFTDLVYDIEDRINKL